MLDREQKIAASSESKPRLFYGFIIAIAAFFVLFSTYGVRFAYGVFFNPMADQLGFNAATTSAAYSISFLLEGVFSFISGGLADRFGPCIVLTYSAILVGLGYCLMPLVHSPWQLLSIYGVLVGVGMGGMVVPLLSTTARWFRSRRNLMTGLVSSGSGVGMLIISPSIALLIGNYGWRTSFVIMGILVLVVVLIAARFIRRDPAGMGMSAYGETHHSDKVELQPVHGSTFKEAMKVPQFWVIFVMLFWLGVYYMSVSIHIVPDAINSGMTLTTAAYIMALSGAMQLVGRISLGTMADRFGNKLVLLLCFSLSLVALFSIAFIMAHWAFFLLAVLMGFSYGGIGNSQSPLVASLFGLKSHGLIFGCVCFAFTIGAAIGPFITGYIFDLTGSYHNAFLICAGANILALLFATLIHPIRNSPTVLKRP